MVNLNKLFLTICVVLLTANFALSQESAGTTSDKLAESDVVADQSPQVREHMQRVQAWFDETNDAIWYRVAFVATVSEIRARKATDKLIGEFDDGETDVAVLHVRVIGKLNPVGLKVSAVIVCPVGKSRDIWKQWQEQKAEMLFEYNRVGKHEFVQKFGC